MPWGRFAPRCRHCKTDRGPPTLGCPFAMYNIYPNFVCNSYVNLVMFTSSTGRCTVNEPYLILKISITLTYHLCFMAQHHTLGKATAIIWLIKAFIAASHRNVFQSSGRLLAASVFSSCLWLFHGSEARSFQQISMSCCDLWEDDIGSPNFLVGFNDVFGFCLLFC